MSPPQENSLSNTMKLKNSNANISELSPPNLKDTFIALQRTKDEDWKKIFELCYKYIKLITKNN